MEQKIEMADLKAFWCPAVMIGSLIWSKNTGSTQIGGSKFEITHSLERSTVQDPDLGFQIQNFKASASFLT